MQTALLSSLPLSEKELNACSKAGLTNIDEILSKSTQQLDGLLNSSIDEKGVSRVRYAACAYHAPKSYSLSELLESEDEIVNESKKSCRSTGDHGIDTLLGGGIHENVLTEISGRFATGKTQILLQSAIFTALGLQTSLDKNTSKPIQGEADEMELYNALQGIGIQSPHKRRSTVLITFDGEAEQMILIRRMKQICDSLIEQRYIMAAEELKEKALQQRPITKRKGTFISSEQQTFTLKEVQLMAQKQLMNNLYLDCPTSYNMLQHTVAYKLPNIIDTLTRSQKRPIGLVILDDLTRLIHEGANLVAGSYSQSATVARSHVCCELSDNLKSIAKKAKAAVLVINHVIDTQDRHKIVIKPWIESIIKGQLATQMPDQFTAKGQNESLGLAFQELQYGGIMAHLNEKDFTATTASSAEAIESIMSDTQMASLGLSWVNCINVRLVLSMSSRNIKLPTDQQFRLANSNLPKEHLFGIRRAVSVLNPFASIDHGRNHTAAVEFIICPSGVHSLQTLGISEEESLNISLCKHEQADEEQKLWNSIGDYTEQEEALLFAQTQEVELQHQQNVSLSQR